jgi:hypothetical protein
MPYMCINARLWLVLSNAPMHARHRHGPNNSGYCDGPHLWQYGTCPTCASYSNNCRQCTLGNHDCAWCGATNSCVNWDDASCGPTKLSSCPCSQYQTCASCTSLSDAQCAWCPNSDNCLSVTANCSGALSTACPCSSNKNCDSCLDDFNSVQGEECSWCGNEVGCQDQGRQEVSRRQRSPARTRAQQLSACGACVATPGCGWCDTSRTPVSIAAKSTCASSRTRAPRRTATSFTRATRATRSRSRAASGALRATRRRASFSTRTYPTNHTCAGLIEHSVRRRVPPSRSTRARCCQLGRGCGWCTVDGNASCVDLDVTLGVFNQLRLWPVRAGPGGLSASLAAFFLGMFVLRRHWSVSHLAR